MQRLLLIAAAVGVMAVLGCGSEDGGSSEATASADDGDHGLPGDPDRGSEVYHRICIACHAADGRGNGGTTGANFVDDHTRLAKTNTELLNSIRNGKQTGSLIMPAQKDALSDQEMKDALSYIRREFGGTH